MRCFGVSKKERRLFGGVVRNEFCLLFSLFLCARARWKREGWVRCGQIDVVVVVAVDVVGVVRREAREERAAPFRPFAPPPAARRPRAPGASTSSARPKRAPRRLFRGLVLV
jgi:hypothetical protein